MNSNDLKIEVMDIECLKAMFLYCGYIPHQEKKVQYEVSRRVNQIDGLVKHLRESGNEYHVSFNGLNYDCNIIQYILDNHDRWYDKTAAEVVEMIFRFSVDTIDDTNHELPPPYKESFLDIKQIDLFKIHHYDNKARRVGLKALEFAMDIPDIEEMPIDFRQEYLTDEEMDNTIHYCWNDVEATWKFYQITTGNTENELYKGKNKIQDRLDIIETLKFDHKALNYADVKIGDEINKKGYMDEAGINMSQLYGKKKDRKPTGSFTFGDCIPKYVKFKTKEFQELYNSIKKVTVNMNKDGQEFEFTYGKTTYSIMRGGIHSHDEGRILEPPAGWILRDADIGSQYPNSINKRKLYPAHLGPKWNVNYEKNIYKRMEFKEMGKSDKKYKGLAETWKLCLNGGGFGMTNQKDNWQYDPKVTFFCTIGNQFEILMLIESLELEGISVMSANTDGIVSMFPETLNDKYYEICHQWEKVVGNDKIGMLEYLDYKKLIQTSVNDYIAIPTEGKVKLKGDFCIDVELHKNKSKRIVPIALYEYFVNGVPVEETVRSHRNIYSFCIGKKASRDYYYEGVNRKTGKVNTYNKLLRYYASTDGEKLYKIKNDNSEKAGPKRSVCESTSVYQQMFNRSFHLENWEEYKIDYKFYIEEVYKIKDKIEKVAARDRKEAEKGLLSLFG